MAGARNGDTLGEALAREGKEIAKGVGKELLSIATLGLYQPKESGTEITIKYPNGKIVKIRK